MTSPTPLTPTGPFGAEPVPEIDAPGRLVAGRYRLSRLIATGGMGQVWRGRDERTERPVAVKVLRAEFAAEPLFVERFRAEARTAGLLDHPNVATVVDYGEQTGPHGEPTGAYLVMELVEGEPLSALLRREAPLDQVRVLGLLAQAAAALQHAHDAGVVHRDVKPANLLITADGTVKITDFGIARAAGALSLTRTGTVLGTAHYLSPEQVQGRSASPASDLYALGVVGYECLAGRRPFIADSPLEVALAHQRDPVPPLPDHVHPTVAALVLRALAKDPADRQRSAGAFGRTASGIAGLVFADGDAQASVAAAAPHAAGRQDMPPQEMPPQEMPSQVAAPGSAPRQPESAPRPVLRRRSVRLPQLVLGLLVLAALAAALAGGVGHHPHRSAAPTAPRTTPRTTPAVAPVTGGLAVDPRSFEGQPAQTVVDELSAMGLNPSVQSVAQAGTPGTVVTIVSAGGAPLPAVVPRGTAVIVQEVGSP